MYKIYFMMSVLLLTACSQDVSSTTVETITDARTEAEIDTVTATENDLIIEWNYDNMDRGNHDYQAVGLLNNKLVIELNPSDVSRGDVVYYGTPDFDYDFHLEEHGLNRVVGLPGETIEIKDGQVYIDHKKLDTFYSEALNRGLNEEEYFTLIDNKNEVPQKFWKEYFSTDMHAVKIGEKSVFVLGDQWWRSLDSREFGPLPMELIEGKVLGYEK